MKHWTAALISLIVALAPAGANAQGRTEYQDPNAPQGNPTREFVMSCTYGVLAGTLVGTASLAFTNKPSESLNRVARGASLGLYAGILLGLYVVYVVPGMESGEEEIEDPLVSFAPRFEDGRLAGGDITLNIFKF